VHDSLFTKVTQWSKSWDVGLYSNSIFNFFEELWNCFTSPPAGTSVPVFPYSYQYFVLSVFFYFSHSSVYEMAFLYGFDLNFSNVSWCWVFYAIIGHLNNIFGKISIQIFYFLNWTIVAFIVVLWNNSLIILDTIPLFDI
jgi:hypothetical protein